MPSEVEIATQALHLLGEKSITSLDDDSDRARLAKAFYDKTRDATLRAHPWNFALARQTLAKLSAAPVFEYDSAFQLPTDPYCLRVLYPDWTPPPSWKIEGRTLVTDQGSVKILYIARIEDPGLFDTLFVEALSARLASKLCGPVTGNYSRANDLFMLYKEALQEARTMDGQEGFPDAFESNFLTEDR